MNSRSELSRRRLLSSVAAMGLVGLPPAPSLARPGRIMRQIPSTGEAVPAVGMGSWITFDVSDPSLRDARVPVLQAFLEQGGALVDSSPMYGEAEAVIGHALPQVSGGEALFSATKVWTPGQWFGVQQMKHSAELWGVDRFDLMQIHNMLDWRTHLETLREWKADGRVRYIGITTSHGRRHDDMADVIRQQPFDTVQFTYNILDREAERRLLPLAADHGRAVIINRPFQRGGLFDRFERHPLPDWAGEIDCRNWAQFFLKFVISHPAVTVAIPATSRVDHMMENMGALYGRLPDAAMRQRMIDYVEAL